MSRPSQDPQKLRDEQERALLVEQFQRNGGKVQKIPAGKLAITGAQSLAEQSNNSAERKRQKAAAAAAKGGRRAN